MNSKLSKRENRVICLPFNQETYFETVNDAFKFRKQLDEFLVKFPELFPKSAVKGYHLKETRFSKKLSLPIRRIRIDRKSYTIRPSFVMPYMTAHVESDKSTFVEKDKSTLLMCQYSVPFQEIRYSFGDYNRFKIKNNIEQNRLIQKLYHLPQHLIVDEKHTWI